MYKPPRCHECEYWREKLSKVRQDRRGECKGTFPSIDPRGYSCWPFTKADDFCYQGKRKEPVLLTEQEQAIEISEQEENTERPVATEMKEILDFASKNLR